jgi:hypothetical protein
MENKTRKRSHGRKRPKPVLAKAKVKATMQPRVAQLDATRPCSG